MSSTKKLINFPCECSPAGDCGKGAGLATWFFHTAGTFHLFQKTCGKWELVLSLDEHEVSHLQEVLNIDYDTSDKTFGWGEEYDAIYETMFDKKKYEELIIGHTNDRGRENDSN